MKQMEILDGFCCLKDIQKCEGVEVAVKIRITNARRSWKEVSQARVSLVELFTSLNAQNHVNSIFFFTRFAWPFS